MSCDLPSFCVSSSEHYIYVLLKFVWLILVLNVLKWYLMNTAFCFKEDLRKNILALMDTNEGRSCYSLEVNTFIYREIQHAFSLLLFIIIKYFCFQLLMLRPKDRAHGTHKTHLTWWERLLKPISDYICVIP